MALITVLANADDPRVRGLMWCHFVAPTEKLYAKGEKPGHDEEILTHPFQRLHASTAALLHYKQRSMRSSPCTPQGFPRRRTRSSTRPFGSGVSRMCPCSWRHLHYSSAQQQQGRRRPPRQEEVAAAGERSRTPICRSSLVSVDYALTGKEAAFLEDVDPAATTVAVVKARIRKKKPDVATTDMRVLLFLRRSEGAAAAAAGAGGAATGGGAAPAAAERLLLDDDERTLASYGVVRSQEDDSDDIVTLQLVAVAPLTPEQVAERSQPIWAAAYAGILTAEQLREARRDGVDLGWEIQRRRKRRRNRR